MDIYFHYLGEIHAKLGYFYRFCMVFEQMDGYKGEASNIK